jgi:hypothetical protein
MKVGTQCCVNMNEHHFRKLVRREANLTNARGEHRNETAETASVAVRRPCELTRPCSLRAHKNTRSRASIGARQYGQPSRRPAQHWHVTMWWHGFNRQSTRWCMQTAHSTSPGRMAVQPAPLGSYCGARTPSDSGSTSDADVADPSEALVLLLRRRRKGSAPSSTTCVFCHCVPAKKATAAANRPIITMPRTPPPTAGLTIVSGPVLYRVIAINHHLSV